MSVFISQVKTAIAVSTVKRWQKLLQRRLCLAASALIILAAPSYADVKLPRLISDGLVIQRDVPVHLWGWADEGEQVTIKFGDETHKVVASNGTWSARFKALPGNKTVTIDIQGNNHLRINNVIAGEVWLAAGQSNMETNLKRVSPRYPNLISSTQLPLIREFRVPVAYSFKGPQADFTLGDWKTATPENLADFSAVGFFFARNLHTELKVPVGIIVIAVGGSPAEAWMSPEALEPYPHYLAQYKKFTDEAVLQHTLAQDKTRVDNWYANANKNDIGLQTKPSWAAAAVDFTSWPTLIIPGAWKDQQVDFVNGVAWLKKNIVLSIEQAQQPATLFLGAVVDSDTVYVNGEQIGQTGYRYPPRIYPLNAGILKAGVNNITIRFTSTSEEPSFVKDKRYALQLGREFINLSGPWHYKIGMRADSYPITTTMHYQPASLFNAKLAPVLKTPLKGVLWYQGESNTKFAQEYVSLFKDLINDWRKQFARADMPFLFVQLPNFMEAKSEPSESEWAQTREAQRNALSLANTGMAVAIDVGEWNDIHPLDKQPIGERLALLAQKNVYGNKKIIAQSPMATAAKFKNGSVIISFDKANDRLKLCSGATLKHIALAAADKKFLWAKAKIINNTVEVVDERISAPKFVRYAWADNPQGANLCGENNLPASPFELPIN
ncbi:MAG TPA: sialate O-acetylesterase [Cellvibrionaceae bacterium]